jgi:hypothetical protein
MQQHLFDELTEDNFILFASRNYNNPQCTNIDEFFNDLQRFKYIKKLFKRYHGTKELQERLIINHIVILYNIFGIRPTNKMMFYKIDAEYWPVLKTFLIYLNYLKDNEYIEVPLDDYVINILRNV